MTVTNRIYLWLLGMAFFAGAIGLSPVSAADPPKPDSLDEQLLKGFSKDGPDDLKDALIPAGEKPTKPGAAQPPQDQPTTKKPSATDEELLKRLTEGEDLGESENALVRIGNKMRKAEGLLGQAKPSAEAQALQQQIVTDLDQLIKQMQRQKSKCDSAKSASTSGGQRGNPSPQKNSHGNKGPNDTPARESTDQLRDKAAQAAELAERKKLLQNLWGDLPQHEREQLLNASGEQFLPKYQLLLEKYFRRLGEQQAP